MSLEHERTTVVHALLEQPGRERRARLILTFADGHKTRVDVRAAEVKLLLALRATRSDQTREGFSEPGWISLSLLSVLYLRLFGAEITPRTLSTHLYRLRSALGTAAPQLLQSEGGLGIRLRMDLQYRGGKDLLANGG